MMTLRLVAIASIGSLFSIGGCSEPANQRTSEPFRGFHPIQIAAESLDFGTVWSTGVFKWVLPVVNASDKPVEVVHVDASCGCTIISDGYTKFTLQPRDQRNIGLTLDLGGVPLQNADSRPFSVNISIRIEGFSYSWQLRGIVRDAFELVEPKEIEFTTIQGHSGAEHRDLVFRKLKSWRDVTLDPSSNIHAEILSQSESDLIVRVYSPPAQSAGSTTDTISLQSVTDEGEIVSGDWPVTYECLPDVFLIPQFTHLGILETGAPKVVQYRLATRSGKKILNVSARSVVLDSAKVECRVTGDRVDLSVTPLSQGPLQFDLTLDTKLSGTELNTEQHDSWIVIPVNAVVL